MTGTSRTWKQSVSGRVNPKVREKTVNSRILAVNLATHDRKGLPGDEGHEGRVESLKERWIGGEVEERTGSRRGPVRTEIWTGEIKGSNLCPSLHNPQTH